MINSKSILAILALAAVVALGGCGGSDSGSSSQSDDVALAGSTGPPTKAEFIKRAEEICRKADRREYFQASAYREKHEKELNKLSPVAAEEKLIRHIVLPSVTRQAEEIEALGAPKGDERKVAAIIAAIEAGVRKAEKDPYSIEFEGPGEYPFTEVAYLTGKYGLGECANPA